MARNVTIGLETFGNTPGCAIASIGAVAHGDDGYVIDELYVIVSRKSCADHGLHEDAETLAWWAGQSEAAQAVLWQATDPEGSMPLPLALDELNRFVARQGRDVLVWGNGSDFDNAIVAAAARAAGVKLAWPFWANACYRTIKRRMPHVKLKRTGTHHNALDDARSQAEHLGRLNRAMRLTSDTIAEANAFLTHMAKRFRERTSVRIFGIRFNSMTRMEAMQNALVTFDATLDMMEVPFGDPDHEWDRQAAHDFVDTELQHWEP